VTVISTNDINNDSSYMPKKLCGIVNVYIITGAFSAAYKQEYGILDHFAFLSRISLNKSDSVFLPQVRE